MAKEFKIRPNVAKHLPVLRKQIQERGWPDIKKCLQGGHTHFLSGKDRVQALLILGREQKGK